MEVLPPSLPPRVRTTKAVGGSELYRYWLSLEIEHYSTTRDTISRDLKTLHAKLIQGFSTLSDKELLVYHAIYRYVNTDSRLGTGIWWNFYIILRNDRGRLKFSD